MLAVFAGWALVGFAYPATPAAIGFNVASKLLAFIAVVGLFFPHWFRQAISQSVIGRRHTDPDLG
jgi:hypothetical protein